MSSRPMRSILVTGACGQIGSELTMALRERYGNEHVVAAGHRTPPPTMCEIPALSYLWT